MNATRPHKACEIDVLCFCAWEGVLPTRLQRGFWGGLWRLNV